MKKLHVGALVCAFGWALLLAPDCAAENGTETLRRRLKEAAVRHVRDRCLPCRSAAVYPYCALGDDRGEAACRVYVSGVQGTFHLRCHAGLLGSGCEAREGEP